MKIKEWITVGIVLTLFTASRSLGAQEFNALEPFDAIEQSLRKLSENVPKNAPTAKVRWSELEAFQNHLWRAMALDPTAGGAFVPPSEVPKPLFSNELNKSLQTEFDELKASNFAKNHQAQFEFEQYLETAGKIVALRVARKFPDARAIAKRGILDSQFEMLTQKISNTEVTHQINFQKDVEEVIQTVTAARDSWVAQNKENERKNMFGNGNQFVWVMLAIFLGFFLGIAAYRISPDFFQKFLDSTEIAQPATTQGANRLDYARWLHEFEELLSRLKSTQSSHERRIEEVVGGSEKITQQALAIYADARVKSEANLEMRMSSLLREIQHQFEQGQLLAQGDRTQIHPVLEHCLKLCDAIENNAIAFDRSKLTNEPPVKKSA